MRPRSKTEASGGSGVGDGVEVGGGVGEGVGVRVGAAAIVAAGVTTISAASFADIGAAFSAGSRPGDSAEQQRGLGQTMEATLRVRVNGELLQEMVRLNEVRGEDVASAYFTTTPDLDAEFPAVAARNDLGWHNVALMCGHEMDVPGSLRMCLRILLHVNTETPQDQVCHAYLRGPAVLWPDLKQD